MSQDLLIHLEYIREKVDGICDRLDAQNGRIRTAENKILVLEVRSEEAAKDSRSAGRNAGALAGSAVSGLVTALGKLLGFI